MKTNAPEKIYIDDPTGEFDDHWSIYQNNDSIEYTRTDAFIEKSCRFIKERLFFEDSWYVEGDTSILDKVIEDFKNYIKEEHDTIHR